ncbi:CarD family transcriptional regulator [Neobacillus bataviensis LMG 21833]|uniref:CarD family transcriptional regulator n=1 Tax=Neobacillus bataviensis LMG 21833 TaxID=1117379 RepID=K6DE84_9BACI|nr:CarD family transcriptional regulator [Neobacillus bataviensis]EKN66609.1 CarD family transcriptional regulator [Neobacillus bataviensis LMG 21833]
MFTIGDLVIYSAHGICKIDDICEKTISGITRTYYVLHPMDNNHQLTISTPVNNDKVVMLELIQQEETNEILESFKNPGIKWVDNPNIRFKLFSDIINTGDRKDIAMVVNTLMQKKVEAELHGKKLYEQDRKLLNNTQNILFKELAISLETTFEEINEMVIRFIKEMK